MNKRFGLLIVCALLFNSMAAWAASPGEYMEKLLAEHDRLKAAEQKLQAAEHGLDAAQSSIFPTLEAAGDAGYQEIEYAGSSHSTEKLRNYQTLRAVQTLYDFGGTHAEIDRAKAQAERARAEYEYVKQNLLFEGAAAYLAVLRSYEKLLHARKSEENIKHQTGIEASLVEKGAGLSSNVLQAKQQLAGAMARRVMVEGELAQAKNRFLSLFGVALAEEDIKDFRRPPAPAGALPATLETTLETALEQNPRILMAAHDINSAQSAADAAWSDFYPTFSAFAEGKRKENYDGEDGVRQEAMLGFQFVWRFNSGLAEYSTYKQAKAGKRQAEFYLADVERNVEEQVRTGWNNFLIFQKNAAYLDNQVALLGEFLDLARRERTMGTRTLLDVLSAETAYVDAQAEALAAELDTALAVYEVLLAAGRLDVSLFQ